MVQRLSGEDGTPKISTLTMVAGLCSQIPIMGVVMDCPGPRDQKKPEAGGPWTSNLLDSFRSREDPLATPSNSIAQLVAVSKPVRVS